MKKAFYLLTPIIVIFSMLVWLHLSADKAAKVTESPASKNASSWEWENPYTGRTVTIPGQWRKAQGEQVKDTLLTLSHETGKSVVYIIYETSAVPMSMQEYVNAMKNANTTELGTDDFETRTDKDGQEYYFAAGAKYFGDNLINTSVRIWSDRTDHFWRTVTMTNSDYRELGFDAQQVLDLLIQSTK